MDPTSTTILFVAVPLLLLIWVIQGLFYSYPENFPPGPTPLPILQNLLSILGGGGFYSNLLQLRGRFGDVFRLCLGNLSMVVVFGEKNVREVLVNKGDIFKHRPNWLYIPSNCIQKKGLFWANGIQWEKLCGLLRETQSSDYRRQHLGNEILTEIKCTFEEIKKNEGAPLDPTQILTRSVFNVTACSALGKRFDHDDDAFHDLQKDILFVMENSKTASPANMFAICAFLARSKLQKVMQRERKVFNYLSRRLDEHRKELDKTCPKDYMDLFLCLPEEERKHEAFSDDCFFRSIIDLFMGGADTTTSMLLWQLVYMVKNPEVQMKCQDEMDRVVGRSNDVMPSDNEKLPYTYATYKELNRIAGSIVLTALRTNTEATTIGDYNIPKNTIVVCDLRQPHMDEQFYPEPHEFRPERFLGEEEPKIFHPFGLGPRVCIARMIAEDLLFTFLANTLHKFRVQDSLQSSRNVTLDSFYTGVSNRPQPYDISFVFRE